MILFMKSITAKKRKKDFELHYQAIGRKEGSGVVSRIRAHFDLPDRDLFNQRDLLHVYESSFNSFARSVANKIDQIHTFINIYEPDLFL